MYITKKKATIPFKQVQVGEVFSYTGKTFEHDNVYLKVDTMPRGHNAVDLTTNTVTYITDTAEVILHSNAELVIEQEENMKITNNISKPAQVFGNLPVMTLFNLVDDASKHLYFKTYTTTETETGMQRNCVNLTTGLIEYIEPSDLVITYSDESELILKEE